MSERVLESSDRLMRMREVITLRDDGFLTVILFVGAAGSFTTTGLTLSRAPFFALLMGVIGIALGGALLINCFLLRSWEIDVEQSRVVKTTSFLGFVFEDVIPITDFDRVEVWRSSGTLNGDSLIRHNASLVGAQQRLLLTSSPNRPPVTDLATQVAKLTGYPVESDI